MSARARAGAIALGIVLAIGAAAGAWAGLGGTHGETALVKVGGHKNACCCTHRIEPEDP